MGHSGSSAILSELREHPQVHLEGTEPVDHHQYQFNSSLALQFTRSFFNRAISYGKTPGFKIRPWHIKHSPKEWAALVREFDTRIVWQYRNNLVKQAVGEYSYKFLNDSSVLEGLKSKDQVRTRCQKGAGCSFRIDDFDFFHKMLKTSFHSDLAIAESVHKIIDGGTCVHPFPYEHYLYDRETSMRRLQQFLGLRYVENEPQRFKATGDNLCKVVENWKELCENFYSCHVWRHMFDDVHNACVCDFSSGHSKYCDTSYD